ncbi:hypothetical protein K435DRAFT_864077 [Dendrothele bispora CBS 962.96]|uniref:TEA domain-containing protein n=1 Tax=Dendrothele bispora (strain CBS 962.96) TaxID=1314807 RepID=A0A4S8LN76_DENBC|nr:hypothetical protein K435DRAFT_864077 [Dendrothele bispora CBS 962.96]
MGLRKHYKLLKNSHSGTPAGEVWPEDVERVFVQGLRAYWDSPWASYSTGRSRWRNQFLVDHLRKHGIDRSKKQVASHLQVLRNMWKGQPESSLLVGLDEHQPKAEDASHLFLFDDSDSHSPMSSPNFSVSDLTSSSNSSPEYTDSARLPAEELLHHFTQLPNSNSVTTFSLFAEGMRPFTVNIDALGLPHSHTLPVVLKIRLQIPSPTDINSPNTLQGFSASLRLANPWLHYAKCTTKLYFEGMRINTESACLDAISIELGCPNACLPLSDLFRCRQFVEPSIRVTITQEIIVDDRTLLFLFYQLEIAENFPTAQLLRFQRYRPGATVPSSSPVSPVSPVFPSSCSPPLPTNSILLPEVKLESMDSSVPFPYQANYLFNPAVPTLSTETSLSNALG